MNWQHMSVQVDISLGLPDFQAQLHHADPIHRQIPAFSQDDNKDGDKDNFPNTNRGTSSRLPSVSGQPRTLESSKC